MAAEAALEAALSPAPPLIQNQGGPNILSSVRCGYIFVIAIAGGSIG
jgi:hypothetical protein